MVSLLGMLKRISKMSLDACFFSLLYSSQRLFNWLICLFQSSLIDHENVCYNNRRSIWTLLCGYNHIIVNQNPFYRYRKDVAHILMNRSDYHMLREFQVWTECYIQTFERNWSLFRDGIGSYMDQFVWCLCPLFFVIIRRISEDQVHTIGPHFATPPLSKEVCSSPEDWGILFCGFLRFFAVENFCGYIFISFLICFAMFRQFIITITSYFLDCLDWNCGVLVYQSWNMKSVPDMAKISRNSW